MKWTSLNELREKYLSFFESKGHLRLPSFPLVPINDKSLLLINSGMAPMKKYFTGEEEPPCRRVTTCQKCIRTPDLERVGHTARHGTFFEMLGNFSFGDYFKEEAIPWAWEFLTKTLEIPAEKLWPSIYENDEEAFRLWNEVVGVPAERITRLGKADNFWEHGTGPCGPCSEIYFDRGEKYGCGSPDCRPGCDCDRYMEIWNNVFSQFNSDGKGHYTELTQKNIDTGMGLERLACVMQGVDNMFEVDSIRKILDKVCEIAGKTYGKDKEDDISIRVCTDHIKSAMFMIADGVIPSNEGRGYVLRRIIRRACRHGKLLSINRPFLCDLCRVAIGENRSAYPELSEKEAYILKVIAMEEERFDATIDQGLSILTGLIETAKEKGVSVIDGKDAFKLYDTFGFPLDLTKEILTEKGLSVDEATFTELMKAQKERARAARGNISGWDNAKRGLLSALPHTEFTGYDALLVGEGKVLAILAEDETGTHSVPEWSEGECTVVLSATPFYGEGGGQVGDAGTLTGHDCTLTVTDTKKTDGIYLHIATPTGGVLKVGDTVTARVDAARRAAIARNHSAAHLLQAALRRVLGNHVEQAGSYVDPDKCRFDFTHFAALTAQELARVEALVNEEILADLPISMTETPLEEAKKMGAMALFGEKYGKMVRVVRMGDFSIEFCGGTHLSNTARIGLFKIVSETSVAAGVRRIEAVTGTGVLSLLHEEEELLSGVARTLKAQNVKDVEKRAQALEAELKETARALSAAKAKLASAGKDELLAKAVPVGSVHLIAARLSGMTTEAARTLCDELKAAESGLVVLLETEENDKVSFICGAGKDAVSAGAHAGKLVGGVAALTDGRGGGRPDNAMAGGKDVAKVDGALAAAAELLRAQLH